MKPSKRVILTEDFVQKHVVKFLSKNGWKKVVKKAELWEAGVDIKVKNDKVSRYWLIEAKGDPSRIVKSPSGSMSSSFNSAIGQIITRMHWYGVPGYRSGYKYGIAFPASFRKMIIKKLPFDIMYRLNLYVFLVDQKGVVDQMNWKMMKKLQA